MNTDKPTSDIYNLDCIAGGWELLDPESVHLTVTSIPFEELFTYSGKIEDVGNNGSTIDVRKGRFAINLRFVIAQLFRVTAAGCNVCIHIRQLLAYKNQHGFMGKRDFRGAVIDLFMAEGFHFHGEWAIPKDPQAMAQRLSLHSLQFKTGHSRSATNWAGAPNDYVLVFQKPGEPAFPVRPLIYSDRSIPMKRADCFAEHKTKDPLRYAEYLRAWGRDVGAKNRPEDPFGERDSIDAGKITPPPNPLPQGEREYAGGWISADDWIKWASGVWHDIDEFDIIDGARSRAERAAAKEAEEEKHVCPLQLEVIRRCVLIYSNPIDIQPDVLVLDPFMGVGSTAAVCIECDRNVVGFELKESYWQNALKNVERARAKRSYPGADEPTLWSNANGEVDRPISGHPQMNDEVKCGEKAGAAA